MNSVEGITQEDLLKIFPPDRDPKKRPLACDLFTTTEGDFLVHNTLDTTQIKPVLITGEFIHRNEPRSIFMRSAWARLMKGAKVLQRAEDTLEPRLLALLKGETDG